MPITANPPTSFVFVSGVALRLRPTLGSFVFSTTRPEPPRFDTPPLSTSPRSRGVSLSPGEDRRVIKIDGLLLNFRGPTSSKPIASGYSIDETEGAGFVQGFELRARPEGSQDGPDVGADRRFGKV